MWPVGPAGVIRTGGPDPRGFLVRFVALARASLELSTLPKPRSKCCHISASLGFSVIIKERWKHLHRQEKFRHHVRVHSLI